LAWRAKHICAGGWDARQHSCTSTNGHLCWRATHPPAQIVSLLAGSLSRLPAQIGICASGCLKEPPRQTDSVLAGGLTNPPEQTESELARILTNPSAQRFCALL